MKNLLAFLLAIYLISPAFAQVNVQSGSATFSLPMFSWQDDKSRLSAAIALIYNSGSGLKVNELPSNVGQGWNLMAGGVITRLQAGEPDDQYPANGSVEDIRKYPPGYLYDPANIEDGCPSAMTRYPLFKDKNHLYKQHNVVAADKELDHFAFQMNGKTGVFVLTKSSILNHRGHAVTLGDSNFDIEFVEYVQSPQQDFAGNSAKVPRTTIVEFDIKDDNGLIYKFSTVEKTKVLTTSYCTAELQQELKQPKFKHGNVYNEAAFDNHNLYNPYVINSWYLSEIEDALTHRKVTFYYGETRNISNTAGATLAYFADKDYTMVSHKTSVTETPALTNISYPDGHQAILGYGADRVDLNGDKVLSTVDLTYSGRYLSRYQLNSSYFILNRYGTPVTPQQKSAARLCLISVQKYAVDLKASEPAYDFDYYQGSSDRYDYVPPPFCHIKDAWGYYNAQNSHDYDNGVPVNLDVPVNSLTNNELKGLCFLRKNVAEPEYFNSNAGFAKNGLLKTISYPTGGKLTYEYEQNKAIVRMKQKDAQGHYLQDAQHQYTIVMQEKMIGGVHVSKTSLTDGGYSNDCDHPIVTSYKYTLSKTNPADADVTSLWGVEEPRSWMQMKSEYNPEDKYIKVGFSGVTCNYHYMNPGIESMDQSVSLTTAQQALVILSDAMSVVGAIMDVVAVVNAVLAGTAVGIIVDIVIDYIAYVTTFAISCLSNPNRSETQIIYYNSDLYSSNPLPGQFKRVETIEGTGQNGKTVQEFTSEDLYSLWAETNDVFSMKQRFGYWVYGLPLKTQIYDNQGNIVKETVNQYDWSKAGRMIGIKTGAGYDGCKCEVLNVKSQKSPDWIAMAGSTSVTDDLGSDLKAHFYRPSTGRVELQSTSERTYKPGALQYHEVLTSYYYNQTNYQVNDVSTVQSNGDVISKHISYNIDYTGDVMTTLANSNILSLPVATTESIKKKGSSDYQYLGEKVTEYKQRPSGDIKPVRIREQRLSQPGPLTPYDWPTDANTTNSTKYHDVQIFSYDANDNLKGMSDEGNHVITNVYGYNDKYVVATVINANPDYDVVAYTSFENGHIVAPWTKSGTGSIAVGNSVTGDNYFPLTPGNSFSVALPTGVIPQAQKPYIFSLWASSNTITVNGNATLLKSGPTLNGYTYYEYSIAAGTPSLSISGTANIDELRVYPSTARMRTISYDPLIGKTSECDENNRSTYYEYDESGRLRFVKDDNRNIVKMYEYNYATKRASDCNVTFYNHRIMEFFTPDNCGAGYASLPVFVTVNAGQFSSNISKRDADLKAEEYLISIGQAYANSHNQCIPVYTNVSKSGTFTRDNCDDGKIGGTYLYLVPAGKYTAMTQDDADQMAQDEVDANGQVSANTNGNGSCTITTEPIWEAPENAQYRCQTDANGHSTGHQEVLATDMNPNSSSNPRTQWKDAGVNTTACPAPLTVYARLSYENVQPTINGTYADIVVRFYSDAQGTIKVAVNNFTVNYDLVIVCDQGLPYGVVQPGPGVVQNISGESVTLASQSLVDYQESTTQCHKRYTLDGASGYQVIQ